LRFSLTAIDPAHVAEPDHLLTIFADDLRITNFGIGYQVDWIAWRR
jgi:hypothetical protein